MAIEQKNTEGPAEEIPYQGNVVPKVLRIIYVVFSVWAVSYLVKFLVPNLTLWLKK